MKDKDRQEVELPVEAWLKLVDEIPADQYPLILVRGGEPFRYPGMIDLLTALRKRNLFVTIDTNGTLLEQYCDDLLTAGVERVNVSLDTLDPERFKAITRRDELGTVLSGIEAARRGGLEIKLNMVVMGGVNDDEILDMAGWALDRDLTVRFIEQMPTRGSSPRIQKVIGSEEILEKLKARYRLGFYERGSLGGPAREFTVDGSGGRVGIISAVTDCFCQQCNRLRVTASGGLRTCLFSEEEIPLKPILRGASQDDLEKVLRAATENKYAAPAFSSAPLTPLAMSAVGG